jgi:RNA polymerase sigma factor (sigma-70 family)
MDSDSYRRSAGLSAAQAAPRNEVLNQELRVLALAAASGASEEERTAAFKRLAKILDEPMTLIASAKLREVLGKAALDPDDVDDVTNLARFQLFKELPRYRPDTEVIPWIVTIVRSQAVDFARWKEHLRVPTACRIVHDDRAAEKVGAPMEDLYLRHRIERVVARLRPDQYQVYHLVFELGHSVAEAAELIDRSRTWVRDRIKRLRAEFGGIR